jgi:hypothetical protein
MTWDTALMNALACKVISKEHLVWTGISQDRPKHEESKLISNPTSF